MQITDKNFDNGNPFDFGRTSADYAKFRDVYPPEFYNKLAELNIGVNGQKILDLGTGTGVLPRNMYKFGGEWIGTDISENQIRYAEKLSRDAGMKIDYQVSASEELDFPEKSFNVVTACQCFMYFDKEIIVPKIHKWLKTNGHLAVLFMAWLPDESEIATKSEELVLKYSPQWSGARETMHPIAIPDVAYDFFELEHHEEYELDVPFTRDSWHGRMRACRGVGASLGADELAQWDAEHRALLNRIAPDSFCVRHYAAMVVLRKR